MTQQNEIPRPLSQHAAIPKTILIVEDDERTLRLFRDVLQTRGHRTLQARDGAEGLRLARRRRPDLIVMDIQLPEISGLETMKWIKVDDDLKAIPIIAVTAFAMKGDEEKIREGGCEAYIAKPVSIRDFLRIVELFLKRDGEGGAE